MGYKIEEGIPLPKKDTTTGASKYPFDQMTPGQSFFVPDVEQGSKRLVARIRGSVAHYRKLNKGARFSVHIVEGGVRVWRIK